MTNLPTPPKTPPPPTPPPASTDPVIITIQHTEYTIKIEGKVTYLKGLHLPGSGVHPEGCPGG